MANHYPASVLRLLKACTAEAKEAMETADEAGAADILLPIAEAIYSPEELKARGRPRLTPRKTFFQNLFFDFREVIAAYSTLADFPTLARSKPPRSQSLSPARLISFWREAYLNEFYIFICRLQAYISRVVRAYRHEPRLAKLSAFPDHFRRLVEDRLGDFVVMRGEHVHQRRYEFSDPELHRLQLLEMLATNSKIPEFVKLYRRAVRQEQASNTKTFKLITREAKDALKGAFDAFEGFMLDSDGRLVYPAKLQVRVARNSQSNAAGQARRIRRNSKSLEDLES